MVAASSHTDNCFGIEVDKLEGTLVQSKLVVPSTRTHGLCKIKDAEMQKPALQAGLYTEISRESVRPGCWVAEKAPGETAWAVGKVHNVVSSGGGGGNSAVKLGVYYPGDTNGDAVATVALHSSAQSISAKPSGCFKVRSTRPPAQRGTPNSTSTSTSSTTRGGGGAARGGVAASMVFFKPNSLRYIDTEGAQCLMSSVRVQDRALLDRREQLNTRERLLVEHELEVQQAFDGVSSDRVTDAAHLETRERLLAGNELKVQQALDRASSDRLVAAEHWQGVKSAFHEQRETAMSEDLASLRTEWEQRVGTTRAAAEDHADQLQRATDSLLAANATIERQEHTAANGKALLAAEQDNAAQANQRLAHANTSLQAHVAKAQESATLEQRATEERVAKLNDTIAELASNNEANATQAKQRLAHANTSLQAHIVKAQENATLEQRVTDQRVAKLNDTIAELTSSNKANAAQADERLAHSRTSEESATLEQRVAAQRVTKLNDTIAELTSDNEKHVRRVALLERTTESDRVSLERLNAKEQQLADRLARSPPHAGAPVSTVNHMHTEAEAVSTRDWNRSRDEKLQPIARDTRDTRQHAGPQCATRSCSVEHDRFVESVVNHMQFGGG
jgi:hypothetical protein